VLPDYKKDFISLQKGMWSDFDPIENGVPSFESCSEEVLSNIFEVQRNY
jgi:hypothetical protein